MEEQGRQKATDTPWSQTGGKDLATQGVRFEMLRRRVLHQLLKAYAELKNFKVFLMDVGLLRALSGVAPKVILEGSKIFEEFKGALTEQFVGQELQLFKRLQTHYYWTSTSKAEVDFLVSDGMEVYPLEAKAGFTMNAKSLKSYKKRYSSTKWCLRTSLLPYERNEEAGIINIPLYMLFALEEELRVEMK